MCHSEEDSVAHQKNWGQFGEYAPTRAPTTSSSHCFSKFPYAEILKDVWGFPLTGDDLKEWIIEETNHVRKLLGLYTSCII
jgi:hypothetical protein